MSIPRFIFTVLFAEDRKRKKSISNARSRIIKNIYTRVTELVGCFAELVRHFYLEYKSGSRSWKHSSRTDESV